MEPAEVPNPEDCCNSGCNPCILDLNLKPYKPSNLERLKNIINIIAPNKYTKFTLVSKEYVNDSFVLLTFKYMSESLNDCDYGILFNSGQYFILKAPVETHFFQHFTRAYTPLKTRAFLFVSNNTVLDYPKSVCFQIFAKLYPDGKMSKYLRQLKIGDDTLWRGPYGSYKYETNDDQHILMICQGIAITTMYSIIEQILNNDEDFTKISLFYSCKNVNNIMLRNALYNMQSYWNFEYKIFLSQNKRVEPKYKEPIVQEKLTKTYIEDYLSEKRNFRVLICGSENFMKDFKDIIISCGVNDACITLF